MGMTDINGFKILLNASKSHKKEYNVKTLHIQPKIRPGVVEKFLTLDEEKRGEAWAKCSIDEQNAINEAIEGLA